MQKTTCNSLIKPLPSAKNKIGNSKNEQSEVFRGSQAQITQHGYSARKGQIVDATLIPVPKQRIRSKEKEITDQKAMPIEWTAHKRAQKDIDASWTTKHGKHHFGYKLGVNVDVRCKIIRAIDLTTAKDHDINQLENLIDLKLFFSAAKYALC